MFESLVTGDKVPNLFIEFLGLNSSLLSDKNKNLYEFLVKQRPNACKVQGYTNFFCVDGFGPHTLHEILLDIQTNSINLNRQYIIPDIFQKDMPTLCYTGCEGWASKEIFLGIELLIEMFDIKGSVTYVTEAINVDELYIKHCETENKNPLFKCYYNGGLGYYNLTNTHYTIPYNITKQLPIEKQKLYCCFNWSAKNHRFVIISLLNYFDLLNEGYVTSPSTQRLYSFSSANNEYQKSEDFKYLVNIVYNMLDGHDLKNDILKKLNEIEDIYPFRIDQRDSFSNPDDCLTKPENKTPLYEARINSCIELITETFYDGVIYFSEKIYNPIALGKPFLIASSPYMLKALKNKGFKTFSPYLNESYDNIENDNDRFFAVVQELKRLKEMKINDSKNYAWLIENINVIAQYNLEWFTQNSNRFYYKHELIHRYLRYFNVGI